jgi:MFS family permease
MEQTRQRDYVWIAVAAGAVFALALGVRQAQPLFIGAINSHTAIGYATISLAFGIAQLMWGVAQPIAGGIADRWGPRPVMIGGVLLLALANAAVPFASSAYALIVLIGVLAAVGAGAIGPSLLMSAASRWIPETKRSMAHGIINAGGSFGQFTLIPLAQLLIGLAGWQPAMVILGAMGLLAVPLLMFLTRGASAHAIGTAGAGTLRVALRQAMHDPSFLLLNAGFFTCGFHVAFIATHLPGVVTLCQLPQSVSAWSLAIIGLFNIMGSLWMGKVIQGRSMKLALSGLYLVRAAL